ncbi:MAG: SagB/ThcOx family dehydrogenase [Fusobacteriaceae bacterium]
MIDKKIHKSKKTIFIHLKGDKVYIGAHQNKKYINIDYNENDFSLKNLAPMIVSTKSYSKEIYNSIISIEKELRAKEQTIWNKIFGDKNKYLGLENLNAKGTVYTYSDADNLNQKKKCFVNFLAYHEDTSLYSYQKVDDFMLSPSKITNDQYKKAHDIKREKRDKLPIKIKRGKISDIGKMISARKSCRSYERKGDIEIVLQIIEESIGKTEGYINEEQKIERRGYPSGGGLYGVDIYLYIPSGNSINKGIYYYNSKESQIEYLKNVMESEIMGITAYQSSVKDATAVVFFVANFPKLVWKYRNRSYRIAHIETGHMAQNITLVAPAYNYKSCCFLGFSESKADEILELNPMEEKSLYMMTIGKSEKRND